MWKISKGLYELLKSGGLSEVDKRFDYWRKNKWVYRKMLDIGNHFWGIEKMVKDAIEMDQQIGVKGLSEVSEDMMRKISLEKKEKNQLEDKYKKSGKPVIFLGVNHESLIEPFVMASILKRRDAALISIKTYQYLGKNYAKYILPVMPKRYASDYVNLKRNWEHKLDPGKGIYCEEKMTMEEISKMNKASFVKAVSLLKKKGAVMIFATGGRNVKASWGRGIGEIICMMPEDLRKEVTIVPILFEGLTQQMTTRSIKDYYTKGVAKKRTISLTYGSKIKASKLKEYLGDQFCPEKVTAFLREATLDDFGIN